MRALVGKTKVRHLLTTRLKLKDPRFVLEKAGARVSGSIISASFRGKSDIARQTMLWDALEAELGAGAAQTVGTLLAYTPEEWDLDLVVDERATTTARRR